MPSSDEMHVKVEDYLTSASFHVEKNLVACPGNPLLPGDLFRSPDHLGNDPFILLVEIIKAADVSLGDDEKMNRSVRMDILENDEVFVLINDRGGFLSPDDLAEGAILFQFFLLCLSLAAPPARAGSGGSA